MRSDVWLSPEVEVRASAIDGQGLFATAALDEGSVVARLGGRLVDGTTLAELLAGSAGYVDTVAVGGDRHLVLPGGTPLHFGNHSCEPNLRWADPVTLVAARPVAAGEELTSDYGASSGVGFRMACRCGAPRCRGEVTGTIA